MVGEHHLRPGGTVSGPSMMTLADAAVYAALLALDDKAGDAVTSNFTIAFLRRPESADVLADAEELMGELGVRFEANASEAAATAMLAARTSLPG